MQPAHTDHTSVTAAPAPTFALGAEHRGDDFWISLAGELDMATDHDLRAALNALSLSPDGVVWLHLADLDFVDAASLLQLLEFTRSVRDSGRQMGVNGLQGVVRRMTELLGLDDELAVA